MKAWLTARGFWLGVAAIGAAVAISLMVLLGSEFVPSQQPAVANTVYSESIIEDWSRARLVSFEVPIRPDESLKRKISLTFDNPTGKTGLPSGAPKKDVRIEDLVPYFPYWQSGDQAYRFHPMAYGGLISRLMPEKADPYLDALVRTGVRLDDGGLLWFYPDNYTVSRMINRYVPSAISQGQILGGLGRLESKGNGLAGELTRAAFQGLASPYWDGGVNLRDKALIELPLENAPPEIILNGWLHALIFLGTYADKSGDGEARALFDSNVEFLAQVLDNFEHPDTRLSMYSDLTPYRVKLVGEADESYEVFYDSLTTGLDDIRVRLFATDSTAVSPYTNHVYASRAGGKIKSAWISASQNYGTYIIADDSFRLSIDSGRYEKKRATPNSGGQSYEIDAHNVGEKWV